MPLEESYIKERLGSYLSADELSVGSIDMLRLGQQDFEKWGSGVIEGSTQWIIDQLTKAMVAVGVSSLDCMPARTYHFQMSNLEGFCYRINASLPGGMLAGYYMGRIERNTYAAFGYGIISDQKEQEAVVGMSWAQVKQKYAQCISGDPMDDQTFSRVRLHTFYRDHRHADAVLCRISDDAAAALRPTNEGMSRESGAPKYHVVHEGNLTGKQIKEYLITVVVAGGEVWEVLL